ncbi:hypothetical protein FSPOR_3241 [Fusarium sporotrichioides]|uniref:Uncharacterized protein n=1 Tax=Fusarium sporotrichioides TaxID=5514 RepID=A0A395SH53_FUSSP|nr:hypothetical protein FSPOR_3241 [Fusarium sporotrichioides]
MALYSTPHGSPIKQSSGSSDKSSYTAFEKPSSETPPTPHSNSPAKPSTNLSEGPSVDSNEKRPRRPGYSQHVDNSSKDKLSARVFDHFNKGQLEIAQAMAEALLTCLSLTWDQRAPLHAMLGIYPFGIEHAEEAVRLYRQLDLTCSGFKLALENARESLALAHKLEALWEAEEIKMAKRKNYTKDQIRHERYQSFYYSAFKHIRKEEFKTLIDAVTQPASASPSLPLVDDSSKSKGKSVETDPGQASAKTDAANSLQQAIDASRAQLWDSIHKYESYNKMQRKTSSQKVDGETHQPASHGAERDAANGTTATAAGTSTGSVSSISGTPSTCSNGVAKEMNGQTKEADAKNLDERMKQLGVGGVPDWRPLSEILSPVSVERPSPKRRPGTKDAFRDYNVPSRNGFDLTAFLQERQSTPGPCPKSRPAMNDAVSGNMATNKVNGYDSTGFVPERHSSYDPYPEISPVTNDAVSGNMATNSVNDFDPSEYSQYRGSTAVPPLPKSRPVMNDLLLEHKKRKFREHLLYWAERNGVYKL